MKYLMTLTLLLTSGLFVINAQVIDVDDFDEISLSRSGTVYVTKGNTYKVELKGDEDAIEETEVEVRGSKLVIKGRGSSWFNWSDNDLEVYVTTPSLEAVHVSSSGKVYVKDPFRSGNMEFAVSGSGKIEMEVNAESIRSSISGSGKIYLSGSAGELRTSISGSGSVRAEDLKVKKLDATISGSGSCEIYVEDEIDARISGSGSVRYKGDPDHVNSRTSGSGKVKKM